MSNNAVTSVTLKPGTDEIRLNRFVKVVNETTHDIEECDTSGEVVTGVAEWHSPSGNSNDIPVAITGPKVEVEAGAAVVKGNVVQTDAQGRAIVRASSGKSVGIALTAASAAGATITIVLNPVGDSA